jgi:hypothetical protein
MFDTSLLADVLRDFDKPANHTGVVPNRVQDNTRPELRAVFANAQTFVLGLPVRNRSSYHLRGQSTSDIFLCVEYRQRFAEDLVRAIAFETLGADIPTSYSTINVESEKRVVPDVLDEKTE